MAKKEKSIRVREKGYFKEVLDELKKVKWPTKNEMLKFTIAVIVFILIFGVYFFALDALFTWVMGLFN